MSLLTTASPWNAGETNKRVSTLRKTIKKTAGISDSIPEYTKNHSLQGSQYNVVGDESSTENLLSQQTSPEKSSFGIYPPDNNRAEKVLELMNNLSPDNDGSGLANFNPPDYPNLTSKPVQQPAAKNTTSDAPIASLPNEFQLTPPSAQFQAPSKDTRFYPKEMANNTFSNYHQSYSPSLNQGSNRYLQATTPSDLYGVNNKLMDKINYMIHMLEQQQNEKTDNIMEEFILYTLLGVFIIFVVDGFARSGNGKYVR